MREALRYQQAREEILSLIKRQVMKPGARLPSEEALGEMLGVSRNTIRDALMTLEQDGVVVRRHGKGTFVAAPPAMLQTRLNEILPIPELIKSSGHAPSVRDLCFELRPGPALAHEILEVPRTEPLGQLSLLHLTDGQPAVYVQYYLIPALTKPKIPWAEFDGRLQDLIETSFGIRVHQTVARIRAVAAPAAIAGRLQVRPRAPLLMFHHTAYSPDGRRLYFSISYQDSNLLGVTVVRRRT